MKDGAYRFMKKIGHIYIVLVKR